MKKEEAKKIIDGIFVQLTKNSDEIPKNFLFDYINILIEKCAECQTTGILFQDEELRDCIKNAVDSVKAYEITTNKIKSITDKNLPDIESVIEKSEDENVKSTTSKLKVLQDNISEELSNAGKTIQEFNEKIKRLKISTRIDKITKMYNKNAYLSDIKPILKAGMNRDLDLCMLLFEIKNLDEIKEQHNEEAYKKILIYFAKLFVVMVRKENKIYRYSNNRFFILLNRSSEEKMVDTAKRITGKLQKQRIVFNNKTVEVEVCVGSSIHKKNDSIESFTRRVFSKKECFTID
jgi:diguanylate cyclase (GGDEF)-like protein